MNSIEVNDFRVFVANMIAVFGEVSTCSLYLIIRRLLRIFLLLYASMLEPDQACGCTKKKNNSSKSIKKERTAPIFPSCCSFQMSQGSLSPVHSPPQTHHAGNPSLRAHRAAAEASLPQHTSIYFYAMETKNVCFFNCSIIFIYFLVTSSCENEHWKRNSMQLCVMI